MARALNVFRNPQLVGIMAKALRMPYTIIAKIFGSAGTLTANTTIQCLSCLLAHFTRLQYSVTFPVGEDKIVIRPFIVSDLSLYIGYKDKEPFVQRVFQPQIGDTVVDAGAHIGFYTLIAARKVGSQGRVIAVEPDPETFNILRKNVQANNLTNVTVINRALTGSEGERRFFSCLDPIYSGFYTNRQTMINKVIKVKTVKLDTLLSKLGVTEVDWIKIDVEGAEKELILGATETLRKSGNLHLIVETMDKELLGRLEKSGMVVERLSDIYYHARKRSLTDEE
jgi:FkbM family methyltransferase